MLFHFIFYCPHLLPLRRWWARGQLQRPRRQVKRRGRCAPGPCFTFAQLQAWRVSPQLSSAAALCCYAAVDAPVCVQVDRRTEAERRHEEKAAHAESRIIAGMAARSNKEKVQQFNTYLSVRPRHVHRSARLLRSRTGRIIVSGLLLNVPPAPRPTRRSCRSTTISRVWALAKWCRRHLVQWHLVK